jgi:ribonuclease-3
MAMHELRISVKAEEAGRARQIIDSHRDDASQGDIAGDSFEPLEVAIGYRFKDRGLLEHALTHRSRVHEDASGGVFDNESLEFLGDAEPRSFRPARWRGSASESTSVRS